VGKAENAFVDPPATPRFGGFSTSSAHKRKKLLGLSLEKVNFLHFHRFFLALCYTIIIVILGFLVFAGF